MTSIILAAIIGFVIGGGIVFAIWNTFLGKTFKKTLAEAEKEGELLKEQKLVEAKKNIVCSNFCQAFRIKVGWNPLYVYYYLQVVYNSGVFFNFEGKTSGLKNLILDSAFQSITIKKVPLQEQDRIANMLSLIDDKIAANHAINDYLAA